MKCSDWSHAVSRNQENIGVGWCYIEPRTGGRYLGKAEQSLEHRQCMSHPLSADGKRHIRKIIITIPIYHRKKRKGKRNVQW